jgi:putative transposase
VELPDPPEAISNNETRTESAVGVDLGITNLATLSSGEVIANPNSLERKLKKLKRFSRALSRKKLDSKNRLKAKRKLARLHQGISNLRSDSLHKLTTTLTRSYTVICLEDLNVSGMTKNKHLSRRLSDSSFGEIRRQLEYKAQANGGRVLFVDTFFPSSKLCSKCLVKNSALKLSDRLWQCLSCQSVHDRDVNAAINIRNHAVSYTVKACGEEGSGSKVVKRRRVKPASVKQELSVEST